MRSIFAAFLALACASALAGEVYKWVDKDGNVHYGDRPKQGGEALDVRPGSGTGTPAETAQAQASRDADCQRKRQQLETYRKASAIKETDSLGRTKEYTPEERAQFVALTEKQVAEACAPPPAANAP